MFLEVKMKIFKIFLPATLIFAIAFCAVACGECEHVDKNDDGACDIADCGEAFTDGCDVHRDANDDGACDVDGCGTSFSDGCDVHRDADDNGVCDVDGCDEAFLDACDIHRDANDDGECDTNGCSVELDDGCDMHRDADDNGKCDIEGCGIDYTDGCDDHRDIDDDGICDNGGEAYVDQTDVVSYTVSVRDNNGSIVKNVSFVLYSSENEELASGVTDKNGSVVFDTWLDGVYVKISALPVGYEELNSGAKYSLEENNVEITVEKTIYSDYVEKDPTQFPIVPNE